MHEVQTLSDDQCARNFLKIMSVSIKDAPMKKLQERKKVLESESLSLWAEPNSDPLEEENVLKELALVGIEIFARILQAAGKKELVCEEYMMAEEVSEGQEPPGILFSRKTRGRKLFRVDQKWLRVSWEQEIEGIFISYYHEELDEWLAMKFFYEVKEKTTGPLKKLELEKLWKKYFSEFTVQ